MKAPHLGIAAKFNKEAIAPVPGISDPAMVESDSPDSVDYLTEISSMIGKLDGVIDEAQNYATFIEGAEDTIADVEDLQKAQQLLQGVLNRNTLNNEEVSKVTRGEDI
jgi:hypothetical protein